MNISVINEWIHVIFGTMALAGGLLAFTTKKGSRIHKMGGRVFAIGMLASVVTTIVFMFHQFLPLAIIMSIATVYLITSAVTALRYRKMTLLDKIILIFPVALALFATIQFFTRFSFNLITVNFFLFSVVFTGLAVSDFTALGSQPKDRIFWIKRHMFRMLLAYSFAIMALLRIGIKLEFLNLELSTMLPMVMALIVGFIVRNNMDQAEGRKKLKTVKSSNTHLESV